MEQVKLTRRSFVAGATAAGALAALSLTGCGGGSSEKKDDGYIELLTVPETGELTLGTGRRAE